MNCFSIRRYPLSFSRSDLAELSAVAIHYHDKAPAFCGWLLDVVTGEQIRRLKTATPHCVPPEVEPVEMPFWKADDLAKALVVATTFSYCLKNPGAGKFMDKICMSLNAVAGCRLTTSET